MTNGEMIQSMFPNINFGTLAQDDVIVNRDYSNNDEPQVFIPKSVWNAEYKEPRKGHWITKPHVYGVTYCSECDFELKIDDTNYCPNCGADMREVEE